MCSNWDVCWPPTWSALKSGILAGLMAGCGGDPDGMRSWDVLRKPCTGVRVCGGERGREGEVPTRCFSGNGQLGGERDLSEAWCGQMTTPSTVLKRWSGEGSSVGGANPFNFT